MKIDKVIFSTSEEYSGFWNIQSKIFKKGLGIDPVCLLFGKKSNTNMCEEHGKVIEMQFYENLPKILQITWSKYDFPKTEPETTWLMGDIDMIPLTKSWFHHHGLSEISDETYVHMDLGGCAMGMDMPLDTWITAGSTTMGGCDLPAHYHVAKGRIFEKTYDLKRSFEEQILSISSNQNYGMGARAGWDWSNVDEKYFWIAEENYSSEVLWQKCKSGEIKFAGFCYDTRNNKDRIDRDAWDFTVNDYVYDLDRLRNGEFVDVHCMRSHGQGFSTQSWWDEKNGFRKTSNSFKDFEKQNMRLIEESGVLNE